MTNNRAMAMEAGTTMRAFAHQASKHARTDDAGAEKGEIEQQAQHGQN